MNWPPYLLRIRIRNPRHGFALWLPLFLLWPVVLAILLAAFLVLLPFALLAMLFTWSLHWWRPILRGLPALGRFCCALRGLAIDLEGSGGQVRIIFD
jgi:hypothetical protein